MKKNVSGHDNPKAVKLVKVSERASKITGGGGGKIPEYFISLPGMGWYS
jgi:hypothetical protein